MPPVSFTHRMVLNSWRQDLKRGARICSMMLLTHFQKKLCACQRFPHALCLTLSPFPFALSGASGNFSLLLTCVASCYSCFYAKLMPLNFPPYHTAFACAPSSQPSLFQPLAVNWNHWTTLEQRWWRSCYVRGLSWIPLVWAGRTWLCWFGSSKKAHILRLARPKFSKTYVLPEKARSYEVWSTAS